MTINNLDKQQNLTELTETEKNRDYYWERLMIVANSIGAIIITVICVIGITLLLKDIFGWKENDAIKIGMVVTFTYWIVLFIFLIYCLVQWILFQNKCQKTEEQLNLTNERERERERRIINWAATY